MPTPTKTFGFLLWVYAAIRVLFEVLGGVDFAVQRISNPGWFGPGWFLLCVVVLGFVLVFWSQLYQPTQNLTATGSRRMGMLWLAVSLALFIVSIVFGLHGYRLLTRGVTWNFETEEPYGFLAMTRIGRGREEPIILSFSAVVTNKSYGSISNLDGYVQSDRTGDVFPLETVVLGVRRTLKGVTVGRK